MDLVSTSAQSKLVEIMSSDGESSVTKIDFGHKLLNEQFSLRKDIVNLNHGSFGTVPKFVMANHIENLQVQESFPEIWFRETIYEVISKSREAIAQLVHANVEEIVLVENASYAVNSILRSFPFEVGPCPFSTTTTLTQHLCLYTERRQSTCLFFSISNGD